MTNQQVRIKVGKKTYDASNSWNSLFICDDEKTRSTTSLSVLKQLNDEKYKDTVEVKLISCAPAKYKDNIAEGFDASLLQSYVKEMERRYETIADACCRNYIEYNQTATEKMKLIVLIIDGAETVVNEPAYSDFLYELLILNQKSRASGIHVITLINELPIGNEDHFEYCEIAHVTGKEFFTKDTANTIMSELFALGFSPVIDVSYDKKTNKTIRISIDAEVHGVQLCFTFNFDDHSVEYALIFPFEDELDLDTDYQLRSLLSEDDSLCYDGFENYYSGRLALCGKRWASQITPSFIQRMTEEICSLKIVEKLKELTRK